MSKSTLSVLEPTAESFGKWLKSPNFRRPTATVLHHTYIPSASQYRGRDSIISIRDYHINRNGWSDIGANAYACPDGSVVTGRPLDNANWSHALISRKKPEAEAKKLANGDKLYFNRNAFGLETVANFDTESPYGSGLAAKSFETALKVLTIVHQTFDIPADRLFFHRDVAAKTCPGTLLNRDRVRAELANRLSGASKIKVVYGTNVIDCKPEWVGGQITVLAAPLLDAIGVAESTCAGAVHANGRAFLEELDFYCQPWMFIQKATAQGPRVYVK